MRAAPMLPFAVVCVGTVLTIGCQHLGKATVMELPARHSVQMEKLLVLSDFRLPRAHPLIAELQRMRTTVRDQLELPEQRDEVVVYLFETEAAYRRYLETTWPGLPWRRAYFVGTPRELSVYTFWGERIQEDLRHEYTHGILHSCLNHVPLWLDEGLAEYFEVSESARTPVNRRYVRELTLAIANGWRPDLPRLEAMTEFSQMQRADYQEAWGWVHFLLHASPETRHVLVDYLNRLRQTDQPSSMTDHLVETIPACNERLASYLGTLQSLPRSGDLDSREHPRETATNARL